MKWLLTDRERQASNWTAAVFFGLALICTPLWAKDQFLPPEQAYRYTTRVEADQIIIQWQVQPGYYLYKKKMAVALASAAATVPASVQLDEPQWPKGENHNDEYFGDQEIYRNSFEVPVAFRTTGVRPAKLALELRLQGCADAGLCYPPLRWKTDVSLPAAAASGGATLQSMFGKQKSSGGNEFLPPDEAFKFGAGVERTDSIALTWIIAKDYYLYKDKIAVTVDGKDVQAGKPVLPQGQPKHDEFFGDTEVYYELLEASVPLARAANSGGKLNLTVTYQGCAEGGLCYNPITKTVALNLPTTAVATTLPVQSAIPIAGAARSSVPLAEQDKLAALIRDGNLLAVLGTFFGLGLLLAFTPCVLPMIPILSGIIVGQGDKVTPLRGFSLAFTYVQGMAVTYAAAGAAFVLLFKQAPQAFFQQPWIIILMATLFIVLAIAMFGAFTLQMPSAIQSRLTDVSNQQKSGTYIGTFVMGALSALVVTACVAPAIIAALSVISQTGQIARGAGALYATGLGMGVPLLIVGASAGSLLPRVGPWMDTIKQLFGALFLGVAIYLLEPLLPDAIMLLLWSALAVITGFWVFSLKARDGGPAPAAIRASGLLMLIYGVILLIGLASGGRDPLQPLEGLRAGNGAGASAHETELTFQRIKSLDEMNLAVAAASAAGKPVMLDFYADWCTSCKEMEKYTFTDAAVRSALANVVLLQADVTANDDQDRALLARFEIYGPPTIAFFDANGVESKNHRVVGFMKAELFAPHVDSAFTGG